MYHTVIYVIHLLSPKTIYTIYSALSGRIWASLVPFIVSYLWVLPIKAPLHIATCELYKANNAQKTNHYLVPYGPLFLTLIELIWWNNHVSATMQGGLIPPGQTSADRLQVRFFYWKVYCGIMQPSSRCMMHITVCVSSMSLQYEITSITSLLNFEASKCEWIRSGALSLHSVAHN